MSMENGKAKLYDRHSELWFQRHIEKAEKAKRDDERTRRLELQECPFCFYLDSGFGGAAMTSWECALCEAGAVNGSTNTPTLCEDCATKEDRCRNCGDKMFNPTLRV